MPIRLFYKTRNVVCIPTHPCNSVLVMRRKDSSALTATWQPKALDSASPPRLHFERRRDLRYQTAIPVGCEMGHRNFVGHLMNLSTSGTCVFLPALLEPSIGQRLLLTLPDGNVLPGLISRHDRECFSIQFETRLLDPTDFLQFDHMGQDFLSNVLAMQQRVPG
jgi:PilZ domain